MNDEQLMSDCETAWLLAKHGPSYLAWEYADRWLRRYREEHPDDERDDYDLLTRVFPDDPARG